MRIAIYELVVPFCHLCCRGILIDKTILKLIKFIWIQIAI